VRKVYSEENPWMFHSLLRKYVVMPDKGIGLLIFNRGINSSKTGRKNDREWETTKCRCKRINQVAKTQGNIIQFPHRLFLSLFVYEKVQLRDR
jgi:hypothetical protein